MPSVGHAVEQRQNKVDYIILDNIDPSATEEEVHGLLLQVIQDAYSAGYSCLSPLSMPTLTTPPPTRPDTFPNWEQELFIPNTLIHLSLEQLPEVVVAEGLGQREVKDEEDLIFRAREYYWTPTSIPRHQQNHWVYWPRVDLQHQDISYDNNFTPCLHIWAIFPPYINTLTKQLCWDFLTNQLDHLLLTLTLHHSILWWYSKRNSHPECLNSNSGATERNNDAGITMSQCTTPRSSGTGPGSWPTDTRDHGAGWSAMGWQFWQSKRNSNKLCQIIIQSWNFYRFQYLWWLQSQIWGLVD